MTQDRPTDPLVSGIKRAFIHFSKAAFEVASGVGELVTGVTRTVRQSDGTDEPESNGPQKIDIE
ncbi:MAG: hypothetical protein BMS9Abin12_0576 [Acidimicrobiia bacterium]|nr:MAG: hypothetical protein BMS9Abin12_0576 [Acidimicrobiia bacterium]